MIFGLERDYFVSDINWRRETERIFSRTWTCAGRIEKLFNESDQDLFCTVQVGDFDILIVQQKSGSLQAFHNVCRHRGTTLLSAQSGSLKNSCVTCPYHGWTYNADGQLIGAPNMNDVDAFDLEKFGLKRIACHDWCGFVMLNPAESQPNFEEEYAEIIDRMKPWSMDHLELKATLEYQVRANWKILFQNYSECYHCPTVHPSLNRLTPYRGTSNDLEEGLFLGGPMELSAGAETISTDGKRVGKTLPELSSEQQRLVYYYTLFPTMFLSSHPDYVMAHEVHPIDNKNTKIHCHFLSDRATQNQDLQRAIEQWDEVNRQDWVVCELTQRGIQSPSYTPGPYSNMEPMLIAFDRYYRQIMNT